MKLTDMKPLTGTYVAVVPTLETLERLKDWADVEGFTLDSNLHITVLYSRRGIHVEPQSKTIHVVKPLGFTALDGVDIVLKVEAPTICLRHEVLRQLGGTHDYPSYLPHVTLKAKAGRIKTPSPITFDLTFTNEYVEPLDLSHA